MKKGGFHTFVSQALLAQSCKKESDVENSWYKHWLDLQENCRIQLSTPKNNMKYEMQKSMLHLSFGRHEICNLAPNLQVIHMFIVQLHHNSMISTTL
jgi:hypothetical protein